VTRWPGPLLDPSSGCRGATGPRRQGCVGLNVVVTLEQRFERLPDGTVWTASPYSRSFWDRYLQVFDGVRIAARARPVEHPSDGAGRVDGGAVSFCALPFYVGPWRYLQLRRQLRRALTEAVGPSDAVVLRVPSQIASCVQPLLARRGHPYAVEVIGDPHEVFAAGVVDHPVRRYLQWHFAHEQRVQCAGAAAAAYTTERVLQSRYPCPAHSVSVFHMPLDDDVVVAAPRSPPPPASRLRLVSVGSLAQLYKGGDVLIEAVRTCVARGVDLGLTVVGGGTYLPQLQAQAREAGLGDRVVFTGHVPAGRSVRDRLDAADLFVLPSRTEGSPAAVVEAMARGLPCVATAVGGVVELLAPEDLVPPGDAPALAALIGQVAGDPDRLRRMAARNLEAVRHYRASVQLPLWEAFYRHVRGITSQWAATGRGLIGDP